MTILKELWTGESESTEVITSYQYVLELRERLKETIKLAQEDLTKSQIKDTRKVMTRKQKIDYSMKETEFW